MPDVPVRSSSSGAAKPIFTVPPGQPFLDAVAAAVLNGDLPRRGGPAPRPLDLPATTILLPTRRATRSMQEAFLRVSGGRAMLLPRLQPIAEGDEDLNLLTDLVHASQAGAADFSIPSAIGQLERQLALTMLVMRWSAQMRESEGGTRGGAPVATAGAQTPAQAARLAAELAALMDMLETETVSLSGLDGIVPDTYSKHWEQTVAFLSIVTNMWPAHLAERGLISPAERRNRLILAEARRLSAHPPEGPVIVAGVTGSIPATAELIRVVTELPNGAIVLPPLDTMLDDESWGKLLPPSAVDPGHPEHPQFGLAKLLAGLGVRRDQVMPLSGPGPHGGAKPRTMARSRLLSEAMRPAATTERWHAFLADFGSTSFEAALDGVDLIEARTPGDEAEAIALILRRVIETPGRTAALVSPDRRLARRVAIRLEAYGITVDDSAGRPFAKTPCGTFLDLIVDAAGTSFTPAAVMALLGHPLTRLGMPAREIRFAARALEISAFRTLYLGRGFAGVIRAFEKAEADCAAKSRRERALRQLRPADWERARTLIKALDAAFAPLTELYSSRDLLSLAQLISAHTAVAEALSALPPEEAPAGGAALWRGEAGEAAALFFASLSDETLPAPKIRAADYADFYRSLLATQNVRPRGPVHPRLSIWGPFESRLQQPDVVILGSLNEGTWPEAAEPGAWLNRPMRQQLGLPSPEEKIGQSAHDFTAMMGAEQVYLTRALKVDGQPTVPSRWLLRLRALLDGAKHGDRIRPQENWLGWVQHRDTTCERKPYPPPQPRPIVEVRPRRLSVSDVEKWISNPYHIFAKHILRLEPMPALGAAPDASLRGSVLHEALGQLVRDHPGEWPADVAGEIIKATCAILEAYAGDARVAAFWLPRFRRFAEWFAETEPARRAGVTGSFAEVSGKLVIDAPFKPFTLSARADRIDQRSDGLVIIDYKTGSLPTRKNVNAGFSPQLPLEAAMAEAIGLGAVKMQAASVLRYVRATGGTPPGDVCEIAETADAVKALADKALAGLTQLVAEFDSVDTPYRAVRRAGFRYDFDDYAHLARVQEWASSEEGEEE